ncbi:MAG: acetoin utilization protein AcuC [Betaproteobacteria bacterium]
MTGRVALVYSPALLDCALPAEHPMHPRRLALTIDLLRDLDLLSPGEVLSPRPATLDELRFVHGQGYLDLVRQSSEAGSPVDGADLFGLGTEDNPVYRGLHETASLIVGGSVAAAERIMAGDLDHAFHPAGGLHHAHRSRASGFCVYNDAAVAIAVLENRYDARVAYVDIDAHHGDGVQFAFYDDPDVLTISFHETGRFLFPGSGDVLERGVNDGYGYAVNVPLEPFTDDESFLETFRLVVPPLLAGFRPDFLVTQHGCDGHRLDVMSDLAYTTKGYAEATALLHELAHALCGGRWLALGGGGYEAERVVPRAWAVQWAVLAGRPLPESVGDRPEDAMPLPPQRRSAIGEKNRLTAQAAIAGSFLVRGAAY